MADFNPAGSDQARIVAAFAARARDRVNLDQFETSVTGGTVAAVGPSSAALRLRAQRRSRSAGGPS